MQNAKEFFYVGGYSNNIRLCEYDGSSIMVLEEFEAENASYLCLARGGKNLYAVREKPDGGVAAFSVDNKRLTYINNAATNGRAPCYIAVGNGGKTLYVANYGTGSIAVYPLNDDGSIGNDRIMIENSSFGEASHVNPERQNGPHAHYAQPIEVDGKNTLWICDLGMDMSIITDENGKEINRLISRPGSGPRHMVFDMPYIYMSCELSGSVYAYKYNSINDIIQISEVSIVEPKLSAGSAIRVTPDGGYVIVSNRNAGSNEFEGTNSLIVLKIDKQDGTLKHVQTVKSGGICPRDFVFNPKGDKIFCANQESDLVTVLNWDKEKGRINDEVTATLRVERPSCIVFIQQ